MILIAGDFCPRNRTSKIIQNKKFERLFIDVRDLISSSKYSIVNFETCVAPLDSKPIDKCGPNLKCNNLAIEALKWAGFDCVTLANNHFRDYGSDAVKKTIEECEKRKIDYVGGGKNISEAQKTFFKVIEGKAFAIINACEHEFSIATEKDGGANSLNPIQQYYAIQEARIKADYVIVIIHGGHEYYQLPSPRMQETYRFFVDAGADVVVNHHQHCFSGYEVYKGCPIFYGLGNFCFDHKYYRNSIWNAGYMVNLKFDSQISFDIIPYTQCNDLPNVELLKGKELDSFFRELNSLNEVIANQKQLQSEFNKWANKTDIDYKVAVTPWQNRYLIAAFVRNLLPSLTPKKKYKLLYNYIACESHRDRFLKALKNKIKR